MTKSPKAPDNHPSRQHQRRKRSPSVPQEGPDPVDVHVGGRLRLRRMLLGLSQEKVGDAVGLTFQQIQKYERGANRISASMLHHLAGALNIPISFFFDDMPGDLAHCPSSNSDDALTRKESVELLRSYYRVGEGVRRQVYGLVRAMARQSGAEG